MPSNGDYVAGPGEINQNWSQGAYYLMKGLRSNEINNYKCGKCYDRKEQGKE